MNVLLLPERICMETNKNLTAQGKNGNGSVRTMGRGGKESVSAAEKMSENEDISGTDQVDKTLQNKLNANDAGTQTGTDRKQRHG